MKISRCFLFLFSVGFANLAAAQNNNVYTLTSNTTYVIDQNTNQLVTTIALGSNFPRSIGYGIGFSADGGRGYVCQDRAIAVLDLITNRQIDSIPLDSSAGCGVQPAITPDGARLWVPLGSNQISVINIAAKVVEAVVPLPIDLDSEFSATTITPDGKKLYAISGFTKSLVVIDTSLRQVVKEVRVVAGLNGATSALVLSPDGSKIVIGEYIGFRDARVVALSTLDESLLFTAEVPSYPERLAVSGNTIYSIDNLSISLFDLATGAVLKEIPNDIGTRVALSQDGTRLFGVGRVLDLQSGTIVSGPVISDRSNADVFAPPPPPPATKALRPIVECLASREGRLSVRFGYLNENIASVTVPTGSNNFFYPDPMDRGQPTTFRSGRVTNAFSVPITDGELAVWTLQGPTGRRTATGSSKTTACAPEPVSLSVLPSLLNVSVGSLTRLTVTATFADGSVGAITNVTWTSSDFRVATVTSDGTLQGNATGTATVTAQLGGLSAAASVTVNSPFSWYGFFFVEFQDGAATLLTGGRVLVVTNDNSRPSQVQVITVPTDGRSPNLATVGNTVVSRSTGVTATALPNGKVLIAGGSGAEPELYDPATNRSTLGREMIASRPNPTATLLPNGKVLLAGGDDSNGFFNSPAGTADLYDPATNTFKRIFNDAFVLPGSQATLLSSGQVLITGGLRQFTLVNLLQTFDPASERFGDGRSFTLRTPRSLHQAVALTENKVILFGGLAPGQTSNPVPTASVEVVQAETNISTILLPMLKARSRHLAVPLPDGTILIVGGSSSVSNFGGSSDTDRTAEIYDPVKGVSRSAGKTECSYGAGSLRPLAVALGDGRVVLLGALGCVEVYQPSRSTF